MNLSHILLSTLSVLSALLSTNLAMAQQNCAKAHLAAPLRESTQSFMHDLDDRFQNLYQTSGFKNDQEIIDAAKASTGEIGGFYKQALDILANENFKIATRLPVGIRLRVAKNGFLNVHEANDSQGSVLGRDHVEAETSGVTDEQWISLPNTIKPKSAALYPADNSDLKAPTALDWYTGKDKYYFKMDHIRNRMTATPGDSLNRYRYWRGASSLPHELTSWDQMFVPWDHRFLLIPVLAEGLKHHRMGLPEVNRPNSRIHPDEVGQQSAIQGESTLANYKMPWNPAMDYVEIQVWGALTLDDVAIFEYTTSPPKGNFLKELQRRGIEIRDGRPSQK